MPTDSSTDGVSQPSEAVQTSPPISSTAVPPASPALMTVTEPIIAGQEFKVSFAGRLRDGRGGYLWVKDPAGTEVALLRGDGNPEIPVGYELDVTVATVLDDGLSGETFGFVFPSELPPGDYLLCTANSGTEECLAIRVEA
jgi:hypothetical protein